jgi:hypothetical protein
MICATTTLICEPNPQIATQISVRRIFGGVGANRLYVLEPSRLTSRKDENQKETVGGIRTGEKKGRKTIPSAGGVRSETDNAVQSASGWERVEAGEKKEGE